MALQEALTFAQEENNTIHFFTNPDSLFKFWIGYYSIIKHIYLINQSGNNFKGKNFTFG
jgi:hypothetical protein